MGASSVRRSVPTMGKVVVDTKRKAVQHMTGGTIKEIFVREGDFVEEGQLLINGDESAKRGYY